VSATSNGLDELLEVMRRLRDPDTGCAWDIAQDFGSIAPHTIEEAYEVADAIARDDPDELREELGDLLFQVVYHARMAEELGAFDFEAVTRGITAKLVHRHPHVFGDVEVDDLPALHARWETGKAQERAGKAPAGTTPSALDGVALALPAALRAQKLQKRAARVGFDWPEAAPVRAKLLEELDEVDRAVAARDADAIEDEIGDLLFSAVNLARHHGVDAERSLVRASAKFERRFRRVERLAGERGETLDQLDIDALDALWTSAKAGG